MGDSRSGRWATLRFDFTFAPLVSAFLAIWWSSGRGRSVLVELGVVEQRYRAVLGLPRVRLTHRGQAAVAV